MLRCTLFITAAAALYACGGADKPPATRSDSTSAAAPAPATTPSGASASADRDVSAIQNYHLTMDNVNKWFVAQRNVAVKLKAMTPAERAALESGGSDGSLDALVAKIDGNTGMRSALQEAGLSAREYALLTMSMVQSGMASGVLKMRPNDNQDSLVRAMKANMDNVKFMRDHEAELNRKQQDLEAEMKRLGVSNAS